MRIASASWLLVIHLAACTDKVAVTDPASPQNEKDSVEAWMRTAVHESVLFLSNRCVELAPLKVLEPGSHLLKECTERAEEAIRAEWDRLTHEGVVQCAASAGEEGCCFSKFVVGPEYEHRQVDCIDRCSLRIGRRVAPNLRANCRTPR